MQLRFVSLQFAAKPQKELIMKMHVIGVSRMSGIAKATQKPYDMAKLLCLQEVQLSAKETFQRAGYGYEICEVDLDPLCISQFAAVKFPAMLECKTDNVMRYGKLQSIVVGIDAAATPAAYAKASGG
jgi:hypothetical protein